MSKEKCKINYQVETYLPAVKVIEGYTEDEAVKVFEETYLMTAENADAGLIPKIVSSEMLKSYRVRIKALYVENSFVDVFSESKEEAENMVRNNREYFGPDASDDSIISLDYRAEEV